MQVSFCLEDRDDPALPVVEKIIADFPHFNATVYFASEDPVLVADHRALGPNPKIRQVSRAYKEAKADIIWAIDCNVWVGAGVCGRMVDKLRGYGDGTVYKFAHQLPLVIETDTSATEEANRLLDISDADTHIVSTSTQLAETRPKKERNAILSIAGGRLEEMFMHSSHAKFYTAINTVSIAPCIVGKSNMYRKFHLDALTDGKGLDFFSHNICEDHLIGDLLWKRPVPEVARQTAEQDPLLPKEKKGKKWGNHGLILGDLAVQPMANMSLWEYIARRARWLRVRKYTVLLATLVEPGTESFLNSLYGAYAVTTLPWFHETLGVPQSWTFFAFFWLVSVSCWAVFDYTQYQLLHSGLSIEQDENTPAFARPPKLGKSKRVFKEWLAGWLGRESLAFPIWFWAVVCGTGVVWRGKKLWVGSDMVVHEMDEYAESNNHHEEEAMNGQTTLDRRKARRD